MRLDAVRTLKSMFAGTTTSHFTDMIEAVFGVDKENLPPDTKEAAKGDEVPPEGLVDKDVASTSST